MDPKIIVVFALLAIVFAERPHLGFQMRFPVSSQIVGGSNAPKSIYPFIVSLQWGLTRRSTFHFCAGSIINNKWILTAGHCIQAVPNYGVFVIKAGKNIINRIEDSEQVIEVKKSIVNEKYGGNVGPYDIGLLLLKTPLTFTKEVQAIELSKAESEPTGDAILSGWGSISQSETPKMPDNLQHIKLMFIDRDTCNKSVEYLTGSSPLHETNVCTGPLDGGTSACNGDSGGPLIKLCENKPVLIGIVSWGIVPCGTIGAPSVYTKVTYYDNWITKNIASHYGY